LQKIKDVSTAVTHQGLRSVHQCQCLSLSSIGLLSLTTCLGFFCMSYLVALCGRYYTRLAVLPWGNHGHRDRCVSYNKIIGRSMVSATIK